jgi:hypothetical protein
MLKTPGLFLYYINEYGIMIKLITYQFIEECVFEGNGKLVRIGETEESNEVYVRVDFDKPYRQALNDFLCDVPSFTKCSVWDNDRSFNGEFVTRSRIDGSPLLKLSKISQYI